VLEFRSSIKNISMNDMNAIDKYSSLCGAHAVHTQDAHT